jgi:cell division protein FtsB
LNEPQATALHGSYRALIAGAVALFLLLVSIAGLHSWRDLEAARQEERSLEERILATREQSDRLRERIDRLRGDPGLLERLAREDLGMARPGDVIVELPAEPAPVKGPPPPAPPGR